MDITPDWIHEKNERSTQNYYASISRELKKAKLKIANLKATIRELKATLANRESTGRRWREQKNNNNKDPFGGN